MSDFPKTVLALGIGSVLGVAGATFLSTQSLKKVLDVSKKAGSKFPKLYIYEHCPFCVRARMIFGWKKIKHDLVFLANDDEITPISLIGAKMVPILEIPDQLRPMGESLDIVRYVDTKLGGHPILQESIPQSDIQKWIDETASTFRYLYHPRFVCSPFAEFAQSSSREYYQNKKEKSIGPFEEALGQTAVYVNKTNQYLDMLEPLITSSSSVHANKSYDDILLFPVLRNLTIVKDIKWPPKVREYIKTVSHETDICLLDALATV